MRLLDAGPGSPSNPAADTCPDCSDELSLKQLLDITRKRKKKAKTAQQPQPRKASRWNIVKGVRHDSLSSRASLERSGGRPVKRERHLNSNSNANSNSDWKSVALKRSNADRKNGPVQRKVSTGEHNEYAVLAQAGSPVKTRAMRDKLRPAQQPLVSAAKKASSKALRLATKAKSKAKNRSASSKTQLRPVIIANAVVMNSPRYAYVPTVYLFKCIAEK